MASDKRELFLCHRVDDKKKSEKKLHFVDESGFNYASRHIWLTVLIGLKKGQWKAIDSVVHRLRHCWKNITWQRKSMWPWLREADELFWGENLEHCQINIEIRFSFELSFSSMISERKIETVAFTTSFFIYWKLQTRTKSSLKAYSLLMILFFKHLQPFQFFLHINFYYNGGIACRAPNEAQHQGINKNKTWWWLWGRLETITSLKWFLVIKEAQTIALCNSYFRIRISLLWVFLKTDSSMLWGKLKCCFSRKTSFPFHEGKWIEVFLFIQQNCNFHFTFFQIKRKTLKGNEKILVISSDEAWICQHFFQKQKLFFFHVPFPSHLAYKVIFQVCERAAYVYANQFGISQLIFAWKSEREKVSAWLDQDRRKVFFHARQYCEKKKLVVFAKATSTYQRGVRKRAKFS